MDPEIERWRKYLRRDPTRFLLDADANPSVYLWYLIDVAHRPEESVAVVDARERVLYSNSVQEIFVAQHPDGFWENADALAEPRFTATLWNLALLAELGIPRDSRRARGGCEFALQNFLDVKDRFTGLDAIESGYLIHALVYFKLASDERVRRAARALIESVAVADTQEARVLALWAWQDFADDPEIAIVRGKVLERVLNTLAARQEVKTGHGAAGFAPVTIGAAGFAPITWPQFEPRDALFVLRVLATDGSIGDPRVAYLVERVIGKQNEWAQWPLEQTPTGDLITRGEQASGASRWATLNAIRVIVKLVTSPDNRIVT